MSTPPDPGAAAADSAPAASLLTAPEIRDDAVNTSRTTPRRGSSTDTPTTPRNPQGSGSAGAAGTPGGGEENDAFGLAFRHALITARDEGWRAGYSVGYRVGYDAACMDTDHAGIGEA